MVGTFSIRIEESPIFSKAPKGEFLGKGMSQTRCFETPRNPPFSTRPGLPKSTSTSVTVVVRSLRSTLRAPFNSSNLPVALQKMATISYVFQVGLFFSPNGHHVVGNPSIYAYYEASKDPKVLNVSFPVNKRSC